jgi:hypothetical protein
VLIHWPHESHVSTVEPEHSTWPGVQTGEGGQEQVPQAQLAVHVWEPYVLHISLAFGSHTPCPVQVPSCQEPFTQVWVSVPQ